jgi:hypothetical protein
MIENIESYMPPLPDSVLQNYCSLSGIKECQRLTHECQSGDTFAFISCLGLAMPCMVAAAQISAPALDNLIRSSVKCY